MRRHNLSAAVAAAIALALVMPVSAFGQDNGASGEAEQSESETNESSDGADSQASRNGQNGNSTLQRSDQMEFDARLIRGERASGAVFLFQRTPRELPSMVERRRTYLKESVQTTLGADWAETFADKRAEAVAAGEQHSSDERQGSSEGSSDGDSESDAIEDAEQDDDDTNETEETDGG